MKAMSSVLMAAVMAVTVTTAACGIPASFKISGERRETGLQLASDGGLMLI
jgi:hypothetical protein